MTVNDITQYIQPPGRSMFPALTRESLSYPWVAHLDKLMAVQFNRPHDGVGMQLDQAISAILLYLATAAFGPSTRRGRARLIKTHDTT